MCWQEGLGGTAHPPTAHGWGECGLGRAQKAGVREMQPGGMHRALGRSEQKLPGCQRPREMGTFPAQEVGNRDANGAVRGTGHRTLNLCGLGSEQ